MLKIGDMCYIKQYKQMVGEVKAISDEDKVTIDLCDKDLTMVLDMVDLEKIEALQPHREDKTAVTILGTPYTILIIKEDDYRYDREADGWCDPSTKEILVFNYKQSAESCRDLVDYQKKVIRHEILHAYLYESGLWQNSYGSKCWAKNEEMIDWMAIQIPKICEAFKEAGVL